MEVTMPKKLDIIYILKPQLDTEELKYSLRSVEANFPHRKVWFVGGKPEGLTPDVMIQHRQVGEDKWDKIRSSMWRVLQEPDLTEDFYLFNDDFFVMKPVKGKFINFADKTLTWRYEAIAAEHKWPLPYERTLYKAREELKMLGRDEVNFEVHLPMLFNKALATESIYKCSSPQMRSVYGNYNRIKYIQHDDVKVYNLDKVPEDPDYLSTNDKTFQSGQVGEFIRGVFSTPSRFETPTPKGVL